MHLLVRGPHARTIEEVFEVAKVPFDRIIPLYPQIKPIILAVITIGELLQ